MVLRSSDLAKSHNHHIHSITRTQRFQKSTFIIKPYIYIYTSNPGGKQKLSQSRKLGDISSSCIQTMYKCPKRILLSLSCYKVYEHFRWPQFHWSNRRLSWINIKMWCTWCYSTCLSGYSARVHVPMTSQWRQVEFPSGWQPDLPIRCWWDSPRSYRWPGSTRGPGRLSRWSSGV